MQKSLNKQNNFERKQNTDRRDCISSRDHVKLFFLENTELAPRYTERLKNPEINL